ncbi:PaaX family transcriptional regulator [Bacillus norwichensis]|uniref:Phenylacetic acid degradation operon negative regulatory protein PaaX n=1 Tax=Bacillus norwichensis TaxID=2762217 RepID=A0ABR8VPL3_9BACI|nr:PaaX family transcriptional regulator C-terminal domain-containing protein [Bacillus norwichensis]MBD8006506.1 phenylacetic acid degradation operon negative regulatory protein PaaX [Bacillus norwichensis]
MKPRGLMFTLFGEYIQHYGGEIWIGSMIRLMSHFGLSESSCRGATLRMVQQGFFQSRKIGNKSYYSLTNKGKRSMLDGVSRVYTTPSNNWDGFWRIYTYSVPEEMREVRNQLRKELMWLGFGPISNSVWATPNPLEKQVMEMVNEHHLNDYGILFTSSSFVSHDNQEIINKGWDMKKIESKHLEFMNKYDEKYEKIKESAWHNSLTDEQCFIIRTEVVHEYRKFLFFDPNFPVDLLPKDWIGFKARELFFNIHQLIAIPAIRYFESNFEQAPDTNPVFDRNRAIDPFIGSIE